MLSLLIIIPVVSEVSSPKCNLLVGLDTPIPTLLAKYAFPETESGALGVEVPIPTPPINVLVAVVLVAVKFLATTSPTTESLA